MQLNVYTEVLNFQVTPTGNTAYGTPRTFSATVVNLATNTAAQSYSGNISFVDGNGTVLCTSQAVNNASLVGTTVRGLSI